MPETSLQELKQHPRVLDLYRSRLSLKQDGKRWRGLCPFHADSHGTNFDVFQHEGTYIHKCLACGVSGSVLDLLQKTDGVDFKGAVAIARQFTSEWSQNASKVESTFKPLGQEEKVRKTYSLEEYGRLENALKNSPAALSFLKSRGIDPSVAQRLRIGFRQDVGKLAGESGASVAAGGWIVFPTLSIGGEQPTFVASLKYRSTRGKYFCKQPGMITELFNKQTIDMLEPVFLVEGEFDALTLEQAGYKAVSLPNAQYQPTPADKDLLLSAEYVVLAGDNDEAGRKAMGKLFREMRERTYLLQWPGNYKDANQFYLEECKGDLSVFRTKVAALVSTAKSKPMEGVYDVRQRLLTQDRESSIGHPNRLKFSLPALDSMAIIDPGTVTTFYSTDSGMGKTTLVFQETLQAAIAHKEVVVNYQAEMSPDQIDTILTSHLLRKDRLTLTAEDYKAAGKLIPAGTQYYIGRNTSFTSMTEVLDLIEAAARRFGATVCVLDNLHFLSRNEQDPIKAQANAMQRITNMAGSLDLKFILVHQARKADQNHKRKVTHVSDLDGSKAVQNDSSTIFSIHREEIKHARDEESSGSNEYDPVTEIRLQKIREKGPGKSYCQLMFLGNICTFSEIARLQEPNLFGQE
jgi:CHC2 zinc finger/DnaB-like helicase C terminal domain/Toprim-like